MNSEPLRIRRYHPADHDAVVALNRYGLAAAGVPINADVYAGDLDDITTTYLSGRNTLLVGEINGAVVAMGAVRAIDDQTCEILRMRVAPEYQGRGHGRAMLAALERHAHFVGFRRAILLTGPDQHPAIDLYTTTGYQITATEDHGSITGIRMERAIP